VASGLKLTRRGLVKGVGWTVGAYGAGQFVRLVSSIVLTRLLSPELFGIMTIVNTVRTGVDLLSDVGIGQSIVQNKNAEDPDFYNTAWTVKLLRGLLLCVVCAASANYFGEFYNSPLVSIVLPVMALSFVLDGFTSISSSLMQKRMKIAALNIYGFAFEVIPGVALVVLAYFFRSIWALVFGLLFSSAVRMVVSYFQLGDVRVKFHISKQYMWDILHFGKWIFFGTLIYFLSGNFDRLYLGKVAPLALLGVYGIARSLADMIVQLVGRLCGFIVFPYIASSSDEPREQLRGKLAPARFQMLLVAAVGMSAFAAVADLPVKIIYDQRYHAAAGMLPIMALGVWFSILCNVNESVLFGFGRPQYAAIGNMVKFGWLLIGLPIGYTSFGFFGIIVVVAVSDFFRYFPLFIGQMRARFSFGVQDIVTSLVMFGLFGVFVWLRWYLGFGVAFDNPVEHIS
jgi:O-antigen/teichoic acid export membrane protein